MIADDFIRANLVHTITIVPPDVSAPNEEVRYDAWGEPVKGYADEELVPCLIDMRTRRVFDSNQRVIVYIARITFPADVKIDVDYKVKNGKTRDGTLLLKEGRVTSLDVIASVDEDVIAKVASVERQ